MSDLKPEHSPEAPKRSSLADAEPRDGSATQPIDPLLGREVGGYRIQSILGSGGLGVVYRGIQSVIDKPVAIKVLRPEFAHDPEHVRRLVAEAKAINAVRHRGIVDVFAIGETGEGRQFLAMELLEGRSLAEVLAGGTQLPLVDALSMFEEILGALAAAHHAGVIHRDIKPSNIFVVQPPYGARYLKVLDFGLAKKTAVPHGITPQTNHSVIIGTPLYMAPEQARGEEVGPHTDLYSAGVVLFEMLTGQTVFNAPTIVEILHQHLNAPPPSPSQIRPAIPKAVDEFLLRLLAKEPARRPKSAEEALSEVRRLVQSTAAHAASLADGMEETVRSQRRGGLRASRVKRWGAVGLLVLAAGAGGALLTVRWGSRVPPTAPAVAPPAAQPSLALPALPPPMPAAVPVVPPVAPPPRDGEPPAPSEKASATAPAPVVPEKLPNLPGTNHPSPPRRPRPATDEPKAASQPAKPSQGVLKLHVFPWADVYVDGQLREQGAMDCEVTLGAGRHSIKLVNPAFPEWEDSVDIEADRTLERRYRLKR
ncbi:MAG: serine/threonine protein kinase [Deltaproteobacteria bacterium]|nr:serine/threonine protein kinase [Deltaproteobacteria bacterium]